MESGSKVRDTLKCKCERNGRFLFSSATQSTRSPRRSGTLAPLLRVHVARPLWEDSIRSSLGFSGCFISRPNALLLVTSIFVLQMRLDVHCKVSMLCLGTRYVWAGLKSASLISGDTLETHPEVALTAELFDDMGPSYCQYHSLIINECDYNLFISLGVASWQGC